MGTISQIKTPGGNRPREPNPADVENGLAALRACRGALEGLPLAVCGSVVSSMMAEFLVRWPEHSRGEILRTLIRQANEALELLTASPPPPDNAA